MKFKKEKILLIKYLKSKKNQKILNNSIFNKILIIKNHKKIN
jgi:hypothetical protein